MSESPARPQTHSRPSTPTSSSSSRNRPEQPRAIYYATAAPAHKQRAATRHGAASASASASHQPARYGAISPRPAVTVTHFSTSSAQHRSVASQTSFSDDIDGSLAAHFDTHTVIANSYGLEGAFWAAKNDLVTSSSSTIVQLWGADSPIIAPPPPPPPPASSSSATGLPISLARSLEPAALVVQAPSPSMPRRRRSRPSIRLAAAANGAPPGGASGGHRSAGDHGHGSNNADDSGSGHDWSSQPRPMSQNRHSTGNGSPSPSPGPGSSTTLNGSSQNSNNNNSNNSSSNPTPFPFPPPRVALASFPIVHPLDVSAASSTPHRALSLSHQIDVSAYDVPLYEFQHGAYGIPKRHPLAVTSTAGPSPKTGKWSQSTSTTSTTGAAAKRQPERRSVLGIAADFLAGPVTRPPPPAPPRSASTTSSNQSSSSAKRWKKIDPETLRSVQVGEDAYFLRPDSLGIADGVGGWATRPGANPAMFSRLLMHFCSVELSRYDYLSDAAPEEQQQHHQKFWDVDPVEVMQRAWERCVRVSREEGILGSSTALLAMLRGDQLRIANLGDCVLLIVRQGHLLFRSQEQQHSFNFPVQLGMMIKRGTRDVEQLLKGWSQAAAEASNATSSSGNAAASPPASEAFDEPESEATIRKHSRHLHRDSSQAADTTRAMQAEVKKREEDALRRRAEFEGRDMDEFEAELQANKEFDFDVESGTARSDGSSNSSGDVGYDVSGVGTGTPVGPDAQSHETTQDGKTVYVGTDEEHPWDEPRRDCGRWTIRVEKGDIIIVASDGLVDNLFDEDILEEVQRFAPPPTHGGKTQNGAPNHQEEYEGDDEDYSLPHDLRRDSGIDLAAMANGLGPEPATSSSGSGGGNDPHPSSSSSEAYPPPAFSPQVLSEALCSRAKAISQDSKAIISPFQQKATEEGLHYVGGKHDDISVLVAVVGEAERSGGGGGKEQGASTHQREPRLMFQGARSR